MQDETGTLMNNGNWMPGGARLIFTRIVAAVLVVQGIGPAFVFGLGGQNGWFLAVLAGIYTFIAVGMWQGRRWASTGALALTAPQFFVFSSPVFSWCFYVFASRGFGLVPAAKVRDMSPFAYHSYGATFAVALGYSRQILANYGSLHRQSFVAFNLLVVPLLGLLLLQRRLGRFTATRPPPLPLSEVVKRQTGSGGEEPTTTKAV